MKNFADIIDAFGGGAALAHKLELEPVTVRAWAQRNSIPAAYWMIVATAAKKSGLNSISVELMARIAESERAK